MNEITNRKICKQQPGYIVNNIVNAIDKTKIADDIKNELKKYPNLQNRNVTINFGKGKTDD